MTGHEKLSGYIDELQASKKFGHQELVVHTLSADHVLELSKLGYKVSGEYAGGFVIITWEKTNKGDVFMSDESGGKKGTVIMDINDSFELSEIIGGLIGFEKYSEASPRLSSLITRLQDLRDRMVKGMVL